MGEVCDYPFANTLDCKKVGLVTTAHNKLREGVAKISGKSFMPLVCAQ